MILHHLIAALLVLSTVSSAAALQRQEAPLPRPRPAAIEPVPEPEPPAPRGPETPGPPTDAESCNCHGCGAAGACPGCSHSDGSRCSRCAEPLLSPVPAGFTDEIVLEEWNQAVGVTFAPDGRAFVWQRGGSVWIVENGEKSAHPLVDIGPEVANWGDHGLVGFALDPHFDLNGHVYLLYLVDHHHLTKFGTPEYDPAADEYELDTIGRLTRYTATPESGFRVVDPASRLVLLGESASTGIPVSGSTHGVGSLLFGEDGTLLVSCGDGHSGDGSNTMLAEGLIQPKENVLAFRAQLVDCLSGKVLRLDPATGDGVPSNPWFDPLAPRAARSRVWSVGLRNPARMTLRPGTGQPSPVAADPGTLCIGDVGAETAEELNLVPASGLNLGWPLYEGLSSSSHWSVQYKQNFDAPNPLYVPGGHGSTCPVPYFFFQSLLVQDSLSTPVWRNSCDFSVPIVTDVPLFVHRRPAIEWLHEGPARVPTYDGRGDASVAVMGTPQSPVAGPDFLGNCSIGGAWSTTTGFPEPWRQCYFHGDYGAGWIRVARFDAQDTLLSVEPFADPIGRVVSLAWDESSGSLWYINYTDTGVGQLRRIRWVDENLPPIAIATPMVTHGPAPRVVQFNSKASSDPEGGPVDVRWDFGDGTPASLRPRPVHTFPSEDITAGGAIIGLIFELQPPGSIGPGNDDPEVMRDGDYPAEGTTDDQRQYDTLHLSLEGLPDKNGECWVGYEFPSERRFVGLLYEEGLTYGGGGWFDTWTIEARSGGVWTAVENVVADPPYPPADGAPHFQTFEFRFTPATGDALRIRGAPGGVTEFDFITVAELRVLAEPLLPLPGPTNYAVTLTVSDAVGAEDTALAKVSVGNSPPVAVITQPANFGAYAMASPPPLALAQASLDAEHGAASLACVWQVILHHNSHSHPGPLLADCTPSPQLVIPEGCGDGAIYWNEIRLTVTDPLGLASTATHWLVPACDRNLNGLEDAIDIGTGASLDLDVDQIPDEAERDCNADGRPDLYELFFKLAQDVNHNGQLDECDRGLGVEFEPTDKGPPQKPPF